MVVVVGILIVKARVTALPAAAPGLLIFVVLWLFTRSNFDFSESVSANIEFLWQSLGSFFLTMDPWGSLAVLHIQPPLLNSLFALDLWLTPSSHLVLGVLYFTCAAGSIVLLVDSGIRLGIPRSWAATAGVVLALMPSTVLYSLWTYNVTLTAFLALATVWGVSVFKSHPVLGVTVSAFSMLGLVLTRTTFVWVILVVWATLLVFMLIRSRFVMDSRSMTKGIAGVLVAVAIALLLQLHYFSSFGLVTMSSWSGQNLAKALSTAGTLNVTPEARAEIATDPCLNDLLVAFENKRVNVWDPGGQLNLPGCLSVARAPERQVLAWDAPLKGVLGLEGDLNYNSGNALVASEQWSRMMSIIVRHDPVQIVKMALGTSDGTRVSGVGLYLSPAESFTFIAEQVEAMPSANALNSAYRFFAPVLWLLIFIGWLSALISRKSALRGMWAYWMASGLLVFHALASTLLEYGENMRFRAEVDPLLLLVGTVSAYCALAQVSQYLKPRAHSDKNQD